MHFIENDFMCSREKYFVLISAFFGTIIFILKCECDKCVDGW